MRRLYAVLLVLGSAYQAPAAEFRGQLIADGNLKNLSAVQATLNIEKKTARVMLVNGVTGGASRKCENGCGTDEAVYNFPHYNLEFDLNDPMDANTYTTLLKAVGAAASVDIALSSSGSISRVEVRSGGVACSFRQVFQAVTEIINGMPMTHLVSKPILQCTDQGTGCGSAVER